MPKWSNNQPKVAAVFAVFKMENLAQVVAIVAVLLFGSGCGAARGAAGAFAIEVKQGCEVVVPTQCQGGVRKFTVDADGNWIVEFREPGQSYSGKLDESDRGKLRSVVGQLFATRAKNGTECSPRPSPPETPEMVSIKRSDAQIVLYGWAGKVDTLCGRPGSAAFRVVAFADRIMRKALSRRP
jgi:hypothetical protein